MHFSESLVEKHGADKIAVKSAEIATQAEKEAAFAAKVSTGVNSPRPVYRVVKESGEKCRIVRPLDEAKAWGSWAPQKYDEIRNWTNDVQKIAKNTGWEEFKIKRIKDHLFIKEHKLREGVNRFGADPEIAAAWDRLYHGDFIKNDITLLYHEYFESKAEGLLKIDYDTAHALANQADRKWTIPIYEG